MNIEHQFLKGKSKVFNLSKGFVLMELILVIGLTSIIFGSFYTMLNLSSKSLAFADEKDEILLQGRYIIDYIKNEVKEADRIISTDKIIGLDDKYPYNIGFVLLEDKGLTYTPTSERFRFFTYYLKNDKLIRISTNKRYDIYPKADDLKGFNEMCNNVISMEDTILDFDYKLLELKIDFGIDHKEIHSFKSTTFLNTILDY